MRLLSLLSTTTFLGIVSASPVDASADITPRNEFSPSYIFEWCGYSGSGCNNLIHCRHGNYKNFCYAMKYDGLKHSMVSMRVKYGGPIILDSGDVCKGSYRRTVTASKGCVDTSDDPEWDSFFIDG